MHRLRRFFFLLALVTFLPACSGYRAVVVPGEVAGPGEVSAAEGLKVGAEAIITLHSGERDTGTIHGLTATDITLGKPSNYGLKKTTYAFAEIESIEVPHVPSVVDGLLSTLGAVAVVCGIGLMVLVVGFKTGHFSIE